MISNSETNSVCWPAEIWSYMIHDDPNHMDIGHYVMGKVPFVT